MTIGEAVDFFVSKNCDVNPLEGGNLTGVGLRIYNRGNRRSHILHLYRGGQVSTTLFLRACEALIVTAPEEYRR